MALKIWIGGTEPPAKEGWTQAKDYSEFLSLLSYGPPKLVSFPGSIPGEFRSSLDCVLLLIRLDLSTWNAGWNGEYQLQDNSTGCLNIKLELESYKQLYLSLA